jgi:tetratricopeptide (TPR) repeat protein
MARLAEADWEGGEDALRKALGLDQAPVDARLREVGTLLASGRPAEAVARARLLVETYPGFPDAHLALALVRRELGEWDDCAESCGAALELNPSYHQARVYLAEALSRRGHWAEADHQLASVFAEEPDHPLAHALAKSLRRASLPGIARPASP